MVSLHWQANKLALANISLGTFPGPTLTADWGDTFQVTVVNNLRTNG